MALTKIRGNTQIQTLTITNTEIAFKDVANPLGILLSKIEDGELLVKSDGSVPFTSPVGGVTPVAGGDLATKNYVDSVATGLDVKQSVRAIATTPISMSGPQTVDGVSLVAGNRVLVAGQAAAETNGIYVVGAGAWVRSADTDNSPAGEVTSGLFTFVEEGTSKGATGWVLSTANPITLGTTPLTFVQFSEAGQITAGAGLTLSGSTVDVVSANAGIVVNADNIALQVSADGTLRIKSDGVALAALAPGKFLVGNNSSVASPVTLSGDVSVDSAGVVTISPGAVGAASIADYSLTLTKLVDGSAPGQIIVTDSSNHATYVTPTGDVTVSATGVFSINPATVVRVSDIIKRETPVGTVDGTNVTFTLANTPKTGLEDVYVNGVLQEAGAGNDYTISGATITMLFALQLGDKIRVSYFK